MVAVYLSISYDSYVYSLCQLVGDLDLDYKIYQYDYLGKIGETGYGSDTAWFSNVFTATGNEKIRDIALYSSVADAEYEITIRTRVTGGPNTGIQVFGPQRGTLGLPGYHRIQLDTPVNVNNGDKFAVIVKMTEPGGTTPIGIMYPLRNYSTSATATAGVGWVSPDGTSWSDAMRIGNQNNVSICLKAFTIPAEEGVIIINQPKVLLTGDAVTLQAYVQGLDDKSVAWSASVGNFGYTPGRFTAPDTPQTVTITATSTQNPSYRSQVQVQIKGTDFDGNTPKNPRLAGIGRAFGSTTKENLDKYDLNGDGAIDNEDLMRLFIKMNWRWY